jgi:hypothetical protein
LSGEWHVLVNPLHPQFSLKWIVTGPDAYTFNARLLPVKVLIRSRRTPRDQDIPTILEGFSRTIFSMKLAGVSTDSYAEKSMTRRDLSSLHFLQAGTFGRSSRRFLRKTVRGKM